jgi:hypothetical protein
LHADSKNGFQKSTRIACNLLLRRGKLAAQCCAGGSGSCIAGGASQGVLQHGQWELNTNSNLSLLTNFTGTTHIPKLAPTTAIQASTNISGWHTGVTKDFTVSLESGYYLGKKEVGLNENPATTYTSKGFGDLIIFPDMMY